MNEELKDKVAYGLLYEVSIDEYKDIIRQLYTLCQKETETVWTEGMENKWTEKPKDWVGKIRDNLIRLDTLEKRQNNFQK